MLRRSNTRPIIGACQVRVAMAKIAYFIMVHQKPVQLDWLMRAIHDERDLFMIHVDAKSVLGLRRQWRGIWGDVKRIVAGKRNVRMMRPRITNWGGWTLSRIQLDAIRQALRADPDWTHFVNLSGQCYPIKPLQEIRTALDAAGDRPMVEMRPFSSLPEDDWHLRWHPMFETPVKAHIRKGRKAPPAGFRLDHKGSQWSILPRSFCEQAIANPLLPEIKRYFRTLLLTDELLMQTLVANGPGIDAVAPHYGREIIWPGPKVLDMGDLPRLRASPGLYARKFDIDADAALMQAIARECGFQPGPLPA
jgi:hypothetical protein